MTSGPWDTLSSWHNAWLSAGPAERERLRRQLAEDDRELAEAAERLIADSSPLDGFLETPALLVAASTLAANSIEGRGPALSPGGNSLRAAWRIAAALAALSVAFFAGWQLGPVPSRARGDTPVVRFRVALPPGVGLLSAPAVSPDGHRIAFAAGTPSDARLMVRELAREGVAEIDGTTGAAAPFWSPDGQWIGFSASGRLMKVPSGGGPPVEIEGAVGSWGGAWGPSDLVFQPAVRNAGLLRVPAGGGRSAQASILDDGAGDVSHRFPVMLPDGQSFLYYLLSKDETRSGMRLARLDSRIPGHSVPLGTLDAPATYVAVPPGAGLLLWAAGDHVEARSFDPGRMRVGEPHAIAIAVAPARPDAPPLLSATASVLAYAVANGESSPPRELGIVIGWRRLARATR